jgi:uncharacterized membrane protein
MNLLIVFIVLIVLFGGGGWYYGGPHIGGGLGGLLLIILLVLLLSGRLFVVVLACLLSAGATVAEATTKTENAAMAACLRYAHARDTTTYCALKRGTKTQQACVKKAEGTDAKRACLVPLAVK